MEISPAQQAILGIAADIEQLRAKFPQLQDFSVHTHCNVERLSVDYAYKTHRAEKPVGWVGGVPNPDAQGVWFTIDFHDPDSTAQIHTQPVTERLWFQDLKVTFLILQGSDTNPIHTHLAEILRKHGVGR